MSHQVLHIANKIIASADADQGSVISNLQMQKLLYYVQGYNLAFYDKPLFEDEIVAWQYGPVVVRAYDSFKGFGKSSISLLENQPIADLSEEEEGVFNEVLDVYGQFNAIKLMNMTHEERPWRTVFYKNPQGVISKDLLRDFFKTKIVE